MNEIILNGRKIEYRGWKVKDKKLLDIAETIIDKRKVVVYNCLKEQIPLDFEEYNYVLALIRNVSLTTPIVYSLECPECGNEEIIELNIPDIISFKEADYTPIIINGQNIEIGNITNLESYEKDITNSLTKFEKYIIDFAYHIKNINGSILTIEDIINYIDNLDIDIFEKIIKEWDKKKSKCTYLKKIKCSCGHEHIYDLENMNDFFPNSWKF